jgi:hypothetical protein
MGASSDEGVVVGEDADTRIGRLDTVSSELVHKCGRWPGVATADAVDGRDSCVQQQLS